MPNNSPWPKLRKKRKLHRQKSHKRNVNKSELMKGIVHNYPPMSESRWQLFNPPPKNIFPPTRLTLYLFIKVVSGMTPWLWLSLRKPSASLVNLSMAMAMVVADELLTFAPPPLQNRNHRYKLYVRCSCSKSSSSASSSKSSSSPSSSSCCKCRGLGYRFVFL